jgi:hypothetical protein
LGTTLPGGAGHLRHSQSLSRTHPQQFFYYHCCKEVPGDSQATPPLSQQILTLTGTHPDREEPLASFTLFRHPFCPEDPGMMTGPRFPPHPGGPIHLLLMTEPQLGGLANLGSLSSAGWSRDWAQLAAEVGVRPSQRCLSPQLCT